MGTRMSVFVAALVLAASLIPGNILGLDYPTREIEFIAPFGPGSSTDAFSRLAAKFGEKHVGKPIVVVNKVGGGGVRGYAAIAAAKPDGYTIGLLAQSVMAHPYLLKGVTYNYKKDFRVIAQVDYSAEGFFTKKGGPYDIPLKELIKRAKEKPGMIKMGVGGSVWGAQDFTRAFLEEDAGIKFNRVPYPAAGDIVPAVLGGHVDIAVGPSAEWAPYYKGGQMSVLAACTDKRDPRYPDIPTAKEQGVDVVFSAYHWIGAPAGTPDPVINFLAEAFKKAFSEQGFKDGCDHLGGTAAWESPQNGLKTMEKVEELYLKVIKKYDLKPQ